MVELEESLETELLILIDEFIQDISGKNLVETGVVIDRLLDMRKTVMTAPVIPL